MIETKTYSGNELEKGVCTSCSEKSNEIVILDGRCVDCIEAEAFYDFTMKMDDPSLFNYY